MSDESRSFVVYQIPLAKGVCVLGVILIHVSVGFVGMTHRGGLFWTLLFLNSLGRFAVPLFLAFSGLYLGLSSRNERAVPFYRRTLRRLLVPYLLYSLLYSLWNLRHGGDPWSLLKDLPFATASYHMWFGLTILQFYLLHPFLRRRYLASRHRGVFVMLAFLLQTGWSILSITLLPAVWSGLSRLLFPGSPATAASLRTDADQVAAFLCLSYIGYFVAGYHLLEHSEEMTRWVKRTILAIPSALVWAATAMALALYWGVPLSHGVPWDKVESYLLHFLLTPLLSFAALLTILSLARNPKGFHRIVRRWLQSFGLYSYGVYYLHPLAIMILSSIYLHVIGPERHDPLSFTLLLFLVVPGVTLLAVKIISKLPAGRYIT